MTSDLVNRKYKAAEVAPVAANVMMQTRGISCKARFQGRCYLHILHAASSKSIHSVQNRGKKQLTSFFFLNSWKNEDIFYVQNLTIF